MGPVYLLTLRQLAGRWRLVILTGLAALPVIVAAVVLATGDSPSVAEFEQVVLNGILAGSIIPLVVLAIATAAFGNEVEDRTLANLTLSPLPRWRIALPKTLASITIAAPFVVISAIVTAQIAYLGDLQATVAAAVGALAGVAMYAAVFTWLGLASAQAMGMGLFYILLWEGFIAGFISGVRPLSIRYQSLAVMHALDARRLAELDHPGTLAVAAVAVVVIGGFFWLAVRRLRRMDVP